MQTRTWIVLTLPVLTALGTLAGCAAGPAPRGASAARPLAFHGPSAQADGARAEPVTASSNPSDVGDAGDASDARETGSAQEPAVPLAPPGDLDAAVRYGLESHAGLRSSFERWQAALERVPQAKSLPDPRFTWVEFVEEVQTRTGPQERKLGLSQTFPWFGVRGTREDAAVHAAEALARRLDAERLAVELEIRLAWHESAWLAVQTEITARNLTLLGELQPVVQQRVRSGGRQEDLLNLQIEIGRLESDLLALERMGPVLATRLGAAMNRSETEPPVEPELTEPADPALDVDVLRGLALAQSPALAELEAEIAQRESEADLRGLERWPDVTLGVDYIVTGDADVPVSGSGDDPVGLVLSMNLPVWSKRLSASEREGERRARAARLEHDDQRIRLGADVQLLAFRLTDAWRVLTLNRDTLLPRAREALELTLVSYRAGEASLLDLIESERAQLDFESAYWRACRDVLQARARLERLIGGPLR